MAAARLNQLHDKHGIIHQQWLTPGLKTGHASMILIGKIFFAVFSGQKIQSKGIAGGPSLYITYKQPEDKSWYKPIHLAGGVHQNCFKPIILYIEPNKNDPEGKLVIHFKRGASLETSQPWILERKFSKEPDLSKNWAPSPLDGRQFGPATTQTFYSEDGKVVMYGSCFEKMNLDGSYYAQSHLEKYNAEKNKYTCFASVPGTYCADPVLFTYKNQLRVLLRNVSVKPELKGHALMVTSDDIGQKWNGGPTSIKTLPNHNRKFDVADLEDRLIAFYNHSDSEELNAALSFDGGVTWTSPILIDSSWGEAPTTCVDTQNKIHLVYTSRFNGDNTLSYAVIDPTLMEFPYQELSSS